MIKEAKLLSRHPVSRKEKLALCLRVYQFTKSVLRKNEVMLEAVNFNNDNNNYNLNQ